MATQVQFRRGTSAETASFIGANGEVTVDTTKKTCVVHDAVQAGGYPLMLESELRYYEFIFIVFWYPWCLHRRPPNTPAVKQLSKNEITV